MRDRGGQGTCLLINAAGTECYDVSSMGDGKGLAGITCRTLAIWLEQRRRVQEATGGHMHGRNSKLH